MKSYFGVAGRAVLSLWFATLVSIASPVEASDFSVNCTGGCHAATGAPPKMLSQSSSYGKIIPAVDDNRFTGSCLSATALFDCNFRLKLKGAIEPMLSYGGSLSNAELETIRLYLIQVRDGAASVASMSIPDAVVGGGSSSGTVTVRVTNYRPTTISYQFSIAGGGDFSMTPATGTCAAATTEAGRNCDIPVTVTFMPGGATSSTRTGSIVVDLTGAVGDAPLPSTPVTISAHSRVPQLAYAPTTAGASAVNPSVSARAGSLASDFLLGTITNTGDGTLSLLGTTITASGGVAATYSLGTGAGACGGTLAGALAPPYASCKVYVHYGPTVAGNSTANLSIAHNGPASSSPTTSVVYGHGTQALLTLLSPASPTVPLGAVEIGKTASTAVVVKNTGDDTLTFDPFTPPSRFSATGCPIAPATLAAGAQCTITVTFAPADTSPLSSTWSITSNAAAALDLTLTGQGTALSNPVVTFATPVIADTVMGELSAEFTAVTIVNNRGRAIRYSLGALTDYQLGTENCVGGTGPGNRDVPANGGSCTIALKFAPKVGTADALRPENVVVSFTGTLPDTNPPTSTSPSPLSGKALLPLGLSAQSLAPATVDGSPTTATMLLTNRSQLSITLASLVISDTFASDYSRDVSSVCANGTVLGTGASCAYVLRFNPPALADGTRTAKLTITHNALGSPQLVGLAGVATPAPQGDIKFDTTPIAFPDTQLGASSTLSRTVQNTGDLALTFSAFTFTGANASEFERSGTCDTATPLPKTVGTCTLTLTFRPAAVGSRSASLVITSDARTPSVSLNLSGTGIPVPVPLVTLPATLAFDKQTVGGLYPARSVTLTNSGTATLNIASIATQGAAFAIAPTSTCTATLVAKAGCTIDVVYVATAASVTDTGSLVVTSNAAGSPHSATLSGVGSAGAVPVLAWAPVAIPVEFGSLAVGTASATQTLTLINQGPSGVTLSVVNAIGPNATSFAVIGGTCLPGLTLFAAAANATTGDGTCTVILQFVPGSGGDKTAQVQVASTGSMPPTMSLHGIGLGGPTPNVKLSATALPFAATRVGAQSLPAELTLTNDGSASLRVLALSVSGPYAVQTKSCPPVPFSLVPNGSCTLTAIFAPQAEGASAGALSITTDADPATREIALSGSGDAAANVSSGGGCSIASGDSLLDPVLWAMALLALAVLAMRGRERALRRREGDPR